MMITMLIPNWIWFIYYIREISADTEYYKELFQGKQTIQTWKSFNLELSW